MFVVVVYDISNNKRRTRLFNALKDFGTQVQYSIFECLLNKKEFKDMQEVVCKITKRRKDKVRIYTLCGSCQDAIKDIGTGQEVKMGDVIVV
jgi:CRISPR-associated protein Cas2